MNRPRIYEGVGEVIYTDADGTYQLVLKSSSGRYEPITQVDQDPEEEMDYRFPLRLYINHKDSGADASGVFLQKAESAPPNLFRTRTITAPGSVPSRRPMTPSRMRRWSR